MDTAAILENAGLTQREAQVYLALLKLKSTGVSTIAKSTGLQRTQLYPILNKLTQKGLARLYYQGRKRQYKPARPNHLVKIAQERLDSIVSVIPALESLEVVNTQTIGLRFIESREELQSFCTDALLQYKAKRIYSIGGFRNWERLVGGEFAEKFRKNRITAKIKTRVIVTREDMDIDKLHRFTLSEIRWLPKKHQFKSIFHIFPDKILISTPQHTSLAVVIEIHTMVDIFKSIFDILWDFLENEKKTIHKNKTL